MIPISLTLRNFMSYGDERTTLDFRGMHVASLSGENGNGKSALLDAMTYALWGKTRASGSQSSTEDDLVRLGAEEMEVTFDFQLGEEQYRVTRKRNRRTRTGDWQASLCDPGGAWRPVGGTGMRETERAMIRILRMEYETFLNSAYIQQGHADEFTRQKPDARKRILADILDLSRYDRLEEMAKERRNECDLLLKDLEGELRHFEARIAEEADVKARLTEQEAGLAAWTERRAAREETLQGLRAQLAALEEKAQFLQRRAEMLRDAEHEAEEAAAQIAAKRRKIAEDAEIVARRPEIVADYALLQETRASMDRLAADVAALQKAQQARTAAEGRLALRKQELRNAVEAAGAEVRRLEEREQLLARRKTELADLLPKLEFFSTAKAEREAVREELKGVQERFTELAAQSKKLQTDIHDTEQVLELLVEPKPACPVCDTDLSGGRHKMVLMRQKHRLSALQESLTEVKREGSGVKKRRDELQQQAESLEAQLRGEAALNANRISIQRQIDETTEQIAASAGVRERLAELRAKWDAGDFGAEEREELARLTAEIAGLAEASEKYAQAQAVARDLTSRNVERSFARLEEAERAQAADLQEVAKLEERRGKRLAQIAAEQEKQAALRQELAGLESMRLTVHDADRDLQSVSAQHDASRAQVERLRHQIEEIARAAEVMKQKKTERDRLAKDKQAYTDLAAAFGKKGVQALIIENALPEIQDEANGLLARLTDSAMQVAINTLRTAKAGSHQIETLDIQITDDAGTRPYEMYSGGEAFRVNFAIRIALSRLLARRAGASLQTLIIDEGFGTQDAKGRERLVEAIEAVKEEFKLILVISHIEELKDAFPTRIEVTKTPAGSRIAYAE